MAGPAASIFVLTSMVLLSMNILSLSNSALSSDAPFYSTDAIAVFSLIIFIISLTLMVSAFT
jgi:hypothetical protein